LLLPTAYLHYAVVNRFPVSRRGSRIHHFAATIGLVALGLLFAGCAAVETERTSTDQNLRSRTVRGPTSEIFNLAARCIYREFPDAPITSDASVGDIQVTAYSLVGGDALIKVTVIGWPDDRVEVNISATGLGAEKKKTAVERFLADFDQEYTDWIRDQTVGRRPVE
jgi:hypothetical protein